MKTRTKTDSTSNTTGQAPFPEVEAASKLLLAARPHELMKMGAHILIDLTGMRDPGATWKKSPGELNSAIADELFEVNESSGERTLRSLYRDYLSAVRKVSPYFSANKELLAQSAVKMACAALFLREAATDSA